MDAFEDEAKEFVRVVLLVAAELRAQLADNALELRGRYGGSAANAVAETR